MSYYRRGLTEATTDMEIVYQAKRFGQTQLQFNTKNLMAFCSDAIAANLPNSESFNDLLETLDADLSQDQVQRLAEELGEEMVLQSPIWGLLQGFNNELSRLMKTSKSSADIVERYENEIKSFLKDEGVLKESRYR